MYHLLMETIPYVEMTQNQQRVLIDASQAFEGYRQALTAWRRYEGGMAWKLVKGREYLIKVINRRGGTKSLGPRTAGGSRRYLVRAGQEFPPREPLDVRNCCPPEDWGYGPQTRAEDSTHRIRMSIADAAAR